ncbi:MAG: HYR domain-containing protein [Saprospiraceae bacterium]|nr:HYR domain-containing protein [Saprospiraceae bacterium]
MRPVLRHLFILAISLLLTAPASAQFQRQFGTNLDETFNKVIKSGTNYYVLGTAEITNGQQPRATVTRLNADGELQWTLSVNTASQWNDAVLTPTGDLLVVGRSLPDDNTSRGIMGRVTSTGTFTWLRSYDQPNRDGFDRIVRNPVPQTGTHPYYVLGHQLQALPAVDDVFLMNIDENGDINWKKIYLSSADDEFTNVLLAMPNGDLILAGHRGGEGLVMRANNTGALFNGATPSQPFTYIDVASAGGAGFYAVGYNFQQEKVQLISFDVDLLNQWEVTVNGFTAVNNVFTAAGSIFLGGRKVREACARISVSGGDPQLLWTKTLDNGVLSQTASHLSFLSPAQIAYVDGRTIETGGFGQNCAFMSLSDLELNTCMTEVEDDVFLTSVSTLYNGPVLPDIEFYDEPMGTNLTGGPRTWQQGEACMPLSCTADFSFQFPNCDPTVSFTNLSTGSGQLSYFWDFGLTVLGIPQTSVAANPFYTYMAQCGTYNVCLTVTGPGCSNTICKPVTIKYTQTPVMVCPPTATVACNTGISPTITGFPTLTGACAAHNFTYTDVMSGSMPCNGTVTRTWTVMDDCGTTHTCIQTILVQDNVPPTAQCEPGFGLSLDEVTCSVALDPEMINNGSFDNCQIQSVSINPAVLNGCGNHTVTLTVTDLCNNTSTCTTPIQTIEITPPLMTCPPNTQVSCDTDALPAMTGTAVANDNCDPSPVVSYTDVASGPIPCGGQIIRTWTARDNCDNESTCQQVITVQDNIPPTITCPSNMTVTATPPLCTAIVNNITWSSVSDNCALQSMVFVVSGATTNFGINDASGSTFNVGLSTVTYTVSDACGNPASCSFDVLVDENVPPTAICLSGVGLLLDATCTASLSPGMIDDGSFDNCQIQSMSVSPNTFNQCGIFPVVLTVIDQSGNSSTCNSSVQVADGIVPTALCSGIGVNLDANCVAFITPELVDGGSYDNCPIQSMSVNPSVLIGCGVFPVTLTVTDNCGNSSNCVAMVQTIESVPPDIMCPPNISVECGYNSAPGLTGIATATDDCIPAPTVSYTDFLNPGPTPCEGVIERTWLATDFCGNTATCTQFINFADLIVPDALCTGGIGIDLDASCVATVPASLIDVGSSDNCQIQSMSVSPASFNQCGTFPVTLTVTDWCGNTSTCASQVQVGDPFAPMITCVPSFSVIAAPPVCTTVVNGLQWTSLSDNCGTPTITYEVTQATTAIGTGDVSGLTFNEGISEITYTATDNCGNTASCTFELEVACAEAEDNCFVWAKQITGNEDDIGRSIAVDAAGNVYTVGTIEDNADLDPGPGVFTLTSNGGLDIFISKLDAAGDFVWAKQIGGIGIFDNAEMILDASGNIILVGFFHSTLDFDPGPGVFNLTSGAGGDKFICKWDASGNFIWAKKIVEAIGAPSAGASIGDFTTDLQGNIYIAGFISYDNFDLDPGPGAFPVNGTNGRLYYFKLDAAGNFAGAVILAGRGDINGIRVNASGEVFITGAINDLTDFDPGPGTLNYYPIGGFGDNDMYVAKYTSGGNMLWAKRMGGGSSDISYAIALDATGGIYFTGTFSNNCDFDPGPGVYTIPLTGTTDMFVGKLDGAGNFVWAVGMGGTFSERPYDLEVDASGKIFLTGFFILTVDFDPGLGVYNLTSQGNPDVFVLKLNGGGNFVSAQQFTGLLEKEGLSIAIDAMGCTYTTGFFRGLTDFDPGVPVYNLTGINRDVFIQKMCPCLRITDTEEPDEFSTGYSLLPCYPNPFEQTTTIEYVLPVSASVRLTVHDLFGRELAVLVNQTKTEGKHDVNFNASNLPSGTYFYHLQAGDYIATRKMVLLKNN